MLHQLAQTGDVDGLRQHLEDGASDVNSLDNEGKTPLLCADYSKPDIVSLLLQYGASVHVQNPNNQESPLHLAVKSKCAESLKLILDADFNMNLLDMRDIAHRSALNMAVHSGILPTAKLLLDRGANPSPEVDAQYVGHGTLLGIAAKAGDWPMVSLLLEQGADLSQKNDLGCKPLFDAVQSKNTEISRRFIELGADVNEQDRIKQTVLHQAVESGHIEQVKLLIENGADIARSDNCGMNALHKAVLWYFQEQESRLELIEYLLDSGIDWDKRADSVGATPLIFALQLACLKIVCCLLERGADLRAKDSRGWTALHFAAVNKKAPEVLEFVLDQGGFNVGDHAHGDGFTALHCAAFNNADENCTFLIRRGADVKAKCSEGMSPLFYAATAFELSLSTADVLLGYGAEVAAESILSALINYEDYDDNDDDMFEMTRFILRHLATLECRSGGSPDAISTEDRRTIENHGRIREYFAACIAELRKMQVCKIFGDVSLLVILTESESIIAGYARNEELVQGFEDKNNKEEFPIYADLVAKRFEKQVEKWRKLVAAAMTLDEIVHLTNDPEHIIYRKIFSYLEDDDFKHLWMEAS